MTEISREVKDMLIADIEKSNIQGIHDTLNIILGTPEESNPNIIPVEFKLSTIKFLEKVQYDLWENSGNQVHYELPQVVELMITLAMPKYMEGIKQKAKASP